MKINVDEKLKTLDGQVMMDNDGKGNAIEASLKILLVNAVLAPTEKELGVEKVKKYELAKMIFKGGEVDLTAEDITLIKKQVGENFAPIVVGQVFEMLEK